MGDPVSLVIAIAALGLASLHAVWVSKRDIDIRVAVSVMQRLFRQRDLRRALALTRAGEMTLLFKALRPCLLHAEEMRSRAPAPAPGSYREAPKGADERAIAAELAEVFEQSILVPERDLRRRRTIGVVAFGVAAVTLVRGISDGRSFIQAAPIVALVALALASWSLARSLRIAARARGAVIELWPLLARCALPEPPPRLADRPAHPERREEPPPPPSPTPVTSWPEEHGVFYAFEDDSARALYERLVALVRAKLPGIGLRIAHLSRVSEARESRPARLVAALGEQRSVADLLAVIARERDDGAAFPDAFATSEPSPSKADLAASFRAKRTYFEVRAAVATGEYELLHVEEPLA